ncbi:RNA 2',3'-cyclic phosphodiesterase [Micropruina sp.]|uniref:RNA 2',3'-cyclic phosphodiesterase n=1 Tax=Micropruina sp. TaxID=2737536 RepID=UPI0026063954|nr:RNA 2',3'-cyclic phosphodiesterase [Micropruina sp.]
MTVRLFAAVVPPAPVLGALEVFVEPRRYADPDLRWVRADSWHLTLAFFGDVTHDRLEPLTEALDDVRGAPFRLTLDGAGAFPDPAAGRVLFQAVSDGSAEFSALSRRVRTAADRVGVPSDNAKHRPHLTLARRRRPGELSRWLRIVDSFPPAAFEVGSFALIQSELRPSGAHYRVLHSFELDARPDSE